MKLKFLNVLTIVCLIPLMSCSQNNSTNDNSKTEKPIEKEKTKKQKTHKYGGWYCPDNLNGFPAVDIKDWESIPVVNGRMATKAETQNGTSLIFVDKEKYSEAKPLDLKMPKLARYKSHQSGKEETVIIIQALNISNDSIVGFRYLNGGNGSSRLNEVTFLTDDEIKELSPSRFVSFSVKIKATSDQIWEVLTKPEHNKALQTIYDKKNTLKSDWHEQSKVNFKYLKKLKYTSEFAGDLWGNKYIQIDQKLGDYHYVEKFFINEDKEAKTCELQIVCGPYGDDFENQKIILNQWAKKVKELTE